MAIDVLVVGKMGRGEEAALLSPSPSHSVQAVQKKEEIWKQGKYETNNFSVLA